MKMNERLVVLGCLQELLSDAHTVLASKKVVAGFDGFVDSIVRVVNYKTPDTTPVFFNTIDEFGSYISNKRGSGFSLESEELFNKLGGNMPIMANAMAGFGVGVSCIGAFGIPSIAPVFSGMHAKCKLFSFTNPGMTTAIEFTDGKMMLAQMTDLNHADWGTIKQALGLEKIIELFYGSDLVCLVNWSELDHSNEIWDGLLKDVFGPEQAKSDKQFFFDLSDCSKRSPEAIIRALDLIRRFNLYGEVTLSLNRNEACILHQTCFYERSGEDLERWGTLLFEHLKIDILIIHSATSSMAWNSKGFYVDEPDFISDPKISTGAGDNFNAGFCMASLLGSDVSGSLMLANMVSNRYMCTGESPDWIALRQYISELPVKSE